MAANIGYLTADKILETRMHAEAGLKADPDNARLLGLLASHLTVDVINGWNGAGQPEVDRAEVEAKKAIAIDHNTPLAHHALGWVNRFRGKHKEALDAFNTAIKIDPNFARAYAQAANEKVFLGDAKGAIPLVDTAIKLSPNDPYLGGFYWVKGRAYFTLGDYQNAIKALEDSINARPNLWYAQAWLVSAYKLTNQDAKAQQALTAYEQKFGAQHDLNRVTQYYQEEQFKNPTMQKASAEMLKGLQAAGLK